MSAYTITDALGVNGDQAAFDQDIASDSGLAAAVANFDSSAMSNDANLATVVHAAGLQNPSQLNPDLVYQYDVTSGQVTMIAADTLAVEEADNSDGTSTLAAVVPTPTAMPSSSPRPISTPNPILPVSEPMVKKRRVSAMTGGGTESPASFIWGIDANWRIPPASGYYVVGYATTNTYCASFFWWDRWCAAANAGVMYGRGSSGWFSSSGTGASYATTTSTARVLNVGPGLYKLDGYEGFYSTWMYFVRHHYHDRKL